MAGFAHWKTYVCKLEPERLVAVESDEGSFGDHAASVAIFPPVITLVFSASAAYIVLKNGYVDRLWDHCGGCLGCRYLSKGKVRG
jgi:hypothetical protein